MGFYKWKPSKHAKEEFVQKMRYIDAYCKEHHIEQSSTSDSYYFEINGQKYRVSNHSVESSNQYGAYKYHPEGREKDVIYIHASKTRIIEIHQNLLQGHKLDGHGYIVG
jgi:hypothetical protein